MLYARIAQLAEQLICNQQVGGSNPLAGSSFDGSLIIFGMFSPVATQCPCQTAGFERP